MMAQRTSWLTPVDVDLWSGVFLLAAIGVGTALLAPLVADRPPDLIWEDLLFVPVTMLAVWWLRRRRNDYTSATDVPAGARLRSSSNALLHQSAWGIPLVLFVVVFITSAPDFFGYGLTCALLAGALGIEGRYVNRWQERSGQRLYRERAGWSNPRIYRAAR